MENLTELGSGVWIAQGAMVSFYGFAYPARSTIIRLTNGDLWVRSPIKLTTDVKRALDRHGPIKHLVSPNKLHHLFLQEWPAPMPQGDSLPGNATLHRIGACATRNAP